MPEWNGFEYIERAKGITIIGYVGSNQVVEIPKQINGKPVIRIGSTAFCGNILIEEVIIADSVQEIGDYALQECGKLYKVILSKELQKIGSYAFRLTDLKELLLPNNITTLGAAVFDSTTDIYVGPNTVSEETLKSCAGMDYGIYELSMVPKNLLLIQNDMEQNQKVISYKESKIIPFPSLELKSDNSSIAVTGTTDSGQLYVKGLKDGYTELLLSRLDTVVRGEVEVITNVTGIMIDKQSMKMDLQRNRKPLLVCLKPKEATNRSLTWSSSNPSVVTVENGILTAVGNGNAKIRVEARTNPEVYAECSITVENKVPLIVPQKPKKLLP